MNEKEEDKIFLQKKANAYLVLGEKVHISYKSGYWKRGIIKEVNEDFFLLDESLEGLLPVFYKEIVRIEKYVMKKEGVEDGTNV